MVLSGTISVLPARLVAFRPVRRTHPIYRHSLQMVPSACMALEFSSQLLATPEVYPTLDMPELDPDHKIAPQEIEEARQTTLTGPRYSLLSSSTGHTEMRKAIGFHLLVVILVVPFTVTGGLFPLITTMMSFTNTVRQRHYFILFSLVQTVR